MNKKEKLRATYLMEYSRYEERDHKRNSLQMKPNK